MLACYYTLLIARSGLNTFKNLDLGGNSFYIINNLSSGKLCNGGHFSAQQFIFFPPSFTQSYAK